MGIALKNSGRSEETPALPVDAPSNLGFAPAGLSRLADVMRSEIARKTMPGAVVMIGRRGKVAFFEAFGVQDLRTGLPMRPDSVFRIFSMTKPVTSIAVMMLAEEGRLRIDEPLAKYIPEFADVQVALFSGNQMDLAQPRRAITLHDLLRHTGGLSHELMSSPLQGLYAKMELARRDRTNEEHARLVATLPLLCHPGTEWNYSRSVELLGRVIEIVSGQSLGTFLTERIFQPLQMHDTGFHIEEGRGGDRLAETAEADPWTGKPVRLFDMLEKPNFEAGGGGLVSTAPDYARFAQMLLNGGLLDGIRIIGSRTLRLMTANHLDPSVKLTPDPVPPGFGFGLGFAVRMHAGMAPFPGAVGQYFWNGSAGTQFWADPAEELWVLLMVQAPGQREHLRVLIRNLVYAAIED
jgi:CubicO group peptidase (beta-lactamase class C family)